MKLLVVYGHESFAGEEKYSLEVQHEDLLLHVKIPPWLISGVGPE